MEVRVFLHKGEIDPRRLAGSAVVVIDVLFATTAMVAALQAGARQVVPFDSPEALLAARGQHPGPQITSAEQDGIPSAGFDCGVLPTAFSPETTRGSTVLMASTNGTRALLRAAGAGLLLVACLGNLTAVAEALSAWPGKVNILCAGLSDRPSLEDTLCAGNLVDHLAPVAYNDTALLARDFARFWRGREEEALRISAAGQYLSAHGFDADIALAARLDWAPLAPRVRGGSVGL